ncbi:MAG: hypothetical protein ACLFPD_10105, partial [Desulfosudaceae bacterium]
MKALFRLGYAVYRPLFFLIVILDTTVLGVITILASYLDPTGRRVHYIGKFWSRLNLLLSGVRVRLVNRQVLDPGRSYIVMSNHQSHYDVWALIAFLPLP